MLYNLEAAHRQEQGLMDGPSGVYYSSSQGHICLVYILQSAFRLCRDLIAPMQV